MCTLAQLWVDKDYELIHAPATAPSSPARIRAALKCLEQAVEIETRNA